MRMVCNDVVGDRYPFPHTWPPHSENFAKMDVVRGGDEWKRVVRLLRESMADAEVTALERYGSSWALHTTWGH